MRYVVVMLLFGALGANVGWAQTSIGGWQLDTKGNDYHWAATVNDSGQVFGQYCYLGDQTCYYIIGLDKSCEPGNKYPVLANSDLGAMQLELLCDAPVDSGRYRYFLTNFDQADEIARKSTRVGFALPLKNDQFTVVRFRLDGAVAAIDAMRSMAEKKVPTRSNTRDQRL